MKMKRLLLLAWTVTALTSAHAQTQQVASASSIGIVPGNLTIDGKAYPVSYDTNEDEGSITIKVYDNAFNVKRSSVIPAPAYEYKYITEESNIVKGTVIYNESECNLEYGQELDPDSIINTPDDFLRFIYYNRYSYEFESLEGFKNAYTCMTDDAGRFITVPQETYVNSYINCPAVGKSLPYIYLPRVGCYNPANRTWNGYANVGYWIDYDPSQATSWTVVSTDNSSIQARQSIYKIYFEDADKGIEGKYLGAQNLFNTDAKTEFILNSYKEVSKEEYYESNSDARNDCQVSKVRSGSNAVLTRVSQDRFYIPVLSIINEDGTKLYDLGSSYPCNYSSTIDIIRLDGSLYIKSIGYPYEVIYSFSPETGIKEVARVKSSNASRSYNLAGQQVNADAKGIIIRDGKKFLNK